MVFERKRGGGGEKAAPEKTVEEWPEEDRESSVSAVAEQYLSRHGAPDELDEMIHAAILAASDKTSRTLHGPSAEPTLAEESAVEVLAARFAAGFSRSRRSDDGDATRAYFQEENAPKRVVLSGRLHKEGGVLRKTAWVSAFLLNDALVLADDDGRSSSRSAKKQNAKSSTDSEDVPLCARRLIRFDDGRASVDLKALGQNGAPGSSAVLFSKQHPRGSIEVCSSHGSVRIFEAGDPHSLDTWARELAEVVGACAAGRGASRHDVVAGTVHWFALHGSRDTALHVREASILNSTDHVGLTPLHLAAQAGRLEALDALLKAGADVDIRDATSAQSTPLHAAAVHARPKCALRLVAAGADAGATDASGLTPFEAAAGSGRLDAASDQTRKSLLLALPRPARPGALHLCARRGLARNAAALLELGLLDPDAPDGPDRDAPLHVAATRASLSVVQALLEAGAKPNVKNAHLRTPLDLVFSLRSGGSPSRRLGVVSALAAAGARVGDGPNQTALQQNSSSSAAAAASSGGEKTPESEAYERGRREWARRELVAEVRPASKDRWTPDSAQASCGLCEDAFNNLSRRRHHCRACGALCCALCSSKLVVLATDDRPPGCPATTLDDTPPTCGGCAAPQERHRVCDACFNRLDARGRRAPPRPPRTATETTTRAELSGRDRRAELSGRDRRDSDRDDDLDAGRRQANETAQDLADLSDQLRLRGEQLGNIATQSEEMATAAGQFRDKARRLRREYEKKNNRFGLF